MLSRQQVGARLREARETKGWTQRDLGERVGLSHVFVGEIERGQSPVPKDRRAAFAKAVGLPVEDLTELDAGTLDVVEWRLRAAGGCERAVKLVREMAAGGVA